jgi:hypothetical protein
MAEIIRPTWKGIREFVSAAIDAAYNDYDSEGRFPRLIIPYAVNKYITNVVVDTFFEPSPEDLDSTMKHLMKNLPTDKLERYARFRHMGDLVLWCMGCVKMPSTQLSILNGQEFYCDAHNIGEKLQEPHAPVLGTIAEEMVYYLPVLSRIPEHLRRQSA